MFGPLPILQQKRQGKCTLPLIFSERNDIMPEYTSAAVQTVAADQNVLFTETPVLQPGLRHPPGGQRPCHPAGHHQPVPRSVQSNLLERKYKTALTLNRSFSIGFKSGLDGGK